MAGRQPGGVSARWMLALALLAFAGLADVASHAMPGRTNAARAPGRRQPPNIVLIRTDDQPNSELNSRTMPRTMKLLVDHGTRFTRSMVTTPQCCPSRAAVLTGQYAHNSNVFSNGAGYPALRGKGNVLPVWLHRAGYRTVHIGKFLNGYTHFARHPADVAPGWDEWETTYGAASRYYDYPLSDHGRKVRYGHRDRDHVTRVLNRKAMRLVRRYATAQRPFYLQLDQRAPHAADGRTKGRCAGGAPQPDPRDAKRFTDTELPGPPSFNEADISDKPPFLQRRELDAGAIARMRLKYQCELASLREVDRGVSRIRETLKSAHAIRRTVFIYTSDNGFFHGEHRIGSGKSLPYEESIRVPLVIRVPLRYLGGASQVPTVSQPVANIDLPPTILGLAGAEPCGAAPHCRVMDGRSLIGLLGGDDPGWPSDRGILIEYRRLDKPKQSVCAFSGIRLANRIYVEYASAANRATGLCEPTRARELYELGTDPFELDNVADAPAHQAEAWQLSSRLETLRACAGIEGRDRRLEGRPFCE